MDREPIPPIHLQRRTTVSRATSWQAITDPDLVARWFAHVSRLGQVGDPYRIDFGDGTKVVGIIVALEPGRRFSHTWRWLPEDESRATRVTWAVEPTSFGSRIVLEHDGWADAGLGEVERNDHADYWDAYLDNLRELLDPDLPEPPEEVQ